MAMESEALKAQNDKPSFVLSIRFLTALLVFFGYAIQYTQKTDMSVSIVCMINNTALKLEQDIISNLTLVNESISNLTLESNTTYIDTQQCAFQSSSKHSDGEFVWTRDVQGYILGSYFIGYLITEIPGGYLSMRFGAKNVFLIAMLLGSVGTFLAPVCAKAHYGALIFIRFLTGLAHGVVWPTVATIWANWAVPDERSRLISIGNAGSQIGNVIALPLGGYLCVNGFAGGWPSIFYVFGILGVVWCIGWFVLGADTPEKHRIISEKEKRYIMEYCHASNDHKNVPWKQLLTNKACMGIIIAHFFSNMGIYLFLTNIPTYMKDVLKFDIKSNGALSALPYLAFWFVILLSGMVGDKFIQSKIFTRTVTRKVFNCLGFLVPMVSIIALSFVRCNLPYLGVALLVVGLSFNGCAYGAGFMVNSNDVVGKYAGILFGISNTIASLPGIIQPYIVGAITKNQTAEEWQIVFIITAVMYLLGAIAYFVLGSGNLQSFADSYEECHHGKDVPLEEINS